MAISSASFGNMSAISGDSAVGVVYVGSLIWITGAESKGCVRDIVNALFADATSL